MKKKDLLILRKSLPKNYAATLAAQFNVTPGYIHKIFRGLSDREDVIKAALQLALEKKQLTEELTNQVHSLP